MSTRQKKSPHTAKRPWQSFFYIIRRQEKKERWGGRAASEWTAGPQMGCDSLASVPHRAESHIIHFAPAEEEKHQALSTAQSAYLSQGFNPARSLSDGFFFSMSSCSCIAGSRVVGWSCCCYCWSFLSDQNSSVTHLHM